jgi:hypothetical protein
MTDFTHQIIGFSWKNGEILRPQLELQQLPGVETQLIDLTVPFRFNWVLSAERYCIGWMDQTGRHPCGKANVLENNHDQCFECENKTGFKSASWFGGAPNDYMQELLKQDHYIYLAFFPPNIIKVGTAAAQRRYKRLMEQDALLAMFIAQADGFNIQKLEHYISKELNYPESVSSKHKYKFISQKIAAAKAVEMLESACRQITAKVERSQYATWLISPQVVDQTENPFVFYPELEQRITELKAVGSLAGDFVGLRGKYLLLRDQSELFSINLQQLHGRKVFASSTELHLPPPEQPAQMNLWA